MANELGAVIGGILFAADRVTGYFRQSWLRKRMHCGSDVHIGRGCTFTLDTVKIGSDVSVGRNCCFQSAHGEIVIGNHVMLGPNVHIHGGNHPIDCVGTYMKNVDSKKLGDDGVIVIEDDCWVGACAVILKGVRIGQGSVIGAGAVVTKDIPPFSIYTGVPDVRLRRRFTEDEIVAHLALLAGSGSDE